MRITGRTQFYYTQYFIESKCIYLNKTTFYLFSVWISNRTVLRCLLSLLEKAKFNFTCVTGPSRRNFLRKTETPLKSAPLSKHKKYY